MKAHFELFDHTADLGVRVRAGTLEDLVAPAVAGLYAAIGRLERAAIGQVRTFAFRGNDPAVLLRDLLAELLYLFESERLMAVDPTVEAFDAHELRVRAGLAAVGDGSTCDREVKAVTYHELALRPIAGGFEATYIVDI